MLWTCNPPEVYELLVIQRGRAPERHGRWVADTLAAAADGGRVVLVVGEAGIGKSALVRRLAERHSADARFLLGACDPLLTPRRWGPCTTLPTRPAAHRPPCWPPGARGSGCSRPSWTSSTSRPGHRSS
jgi:hypothetical protein